MNQNRVFRGVVWTSATPTAAQKLRTRGKEPDLPQFPGPKILTCYIPKQCQQHLPRQPLHTQRHRPPEITPYRSSQRNGKKQRLLRLSLLDCSNSHDSKALITLRYTTYITCRMTPTLEYTSWWRVQQIYNIIDWTIRPPPKHASCGATSKSGAGKLVPLFCPIR